MILRLVSVAGKNFPQIPKRDADFTANWTFLGHGFLCG